VKNGARFLCAVADDEGIFELSVGKLVYGLRATPGNIDRLRFSRWCLLHILALWKIVEEEIDRSNTTVPGHDRDGRPRDGYSENFPSLLRLTVSGR